MPSLLYTLGLFILSRDMQRRGKAVCSKREKEMTWTTQNKMITLMRAKKKGGSAGKSLWSSVHTSTSLHVSKGEGHIPKTDSGSEFRKDKHLPV